MFRRTRFEDLVRTQLELFEEDERSLLQEARAAERAWTNAGADEAEERYGDYQLVVDAIGERLHDVRDTYAASLDDRAADEYGAVFAKSATKRFGRLAAALLE